MTSAAVCLESIYMSYRVPRIKSTHRLVRLPALARPMRMDSRIRAMPGCPMGRRLAKSFDNATEFALAVLSGKWKTTILCYLDERPRRYGELRALISGLSDKVLTERLRDLRNLGLVTQRRSPCSSSGLYVLTRRGKMLQRVLRDLHAWGRQHSAVFGVKLTEPQRRSGWD